MDDPEIGRLHCLAARAIADGADELVMRQWRVPFKQAAKMLREASA